MWRALDNVIEQLDRPFTHRGLVIGSAVFLLLYGVIGVASHLVLKNGVNPTGEPLGQDFICFFAASKLILLGDPAGVYGEAFKQAQHAVFPGITANYLWHYPPPAHFLAAPLALLPYVSSFLVWDAVGLVLFLRVAYWLLPQRLTILVCAAAPAVFWNAWHHQNGFLLAAVLAIGYRLAGSRQIGAGAVLGLFAVKPHLAIAAPFLFAVSRRWTAFAAAAAVAVGLVGLSAIAFGLETWRAFFDVADRARAVLEEPFLPRAIMPSVFAAAALAGAATPVAYFLHGLVAFSGLAAAARVWMCSEDRDLRTAAALSATVLLTPYLFHYDLTVLVLAGVSLMSFARRSSLPRGAPGLLALAWIAPLMAPPIAFLFEVQLMPLAAVAVLLLAVAAAERPARKLAVAEAAA